MSFKDIGNKMNKIIFRSFKEPIRENITWNERWKGSDKGLIMCWEVGRNLKQKKRRRDDLFGVFGIFPSVPMGEENSR